jgi:hypothetical protein
MILHLNNLSSVTSAKLKHYPNEDLVDSHSETFGSFPPRSIKIYVSCSTTRDGLATWLNL